MSLTLLKFYTISSKTFTKSVVSWKELAKPDAQLTTAWFDSENLRSHKIDIQEDVLDSVDMNTVYGFLDGEYGKSMLSVIYKTVSYLPSDSYQQLGLFAKAEILKGSIVKGVIGFLAEIKENEVVEGFNDMSVIYNKLKGIQWIMLGPISFINASCNSNFGINKL